MTTRLKGFVVTLKHDIREDDAEPLRRAIELLTGVADVSPLAVSPDDYVNRMRVRRELEARLFEALKG